MANEIWAITAYFNPMHWRRRLANYRTFRQHLTIPLVAVELGYDGRFELGPDDADIVVQIPGEDVMWQKERLFNLALGTVPQTVDRVACLDSDIVFERADVWHEANRALEQAPIAQLCSHVFYLPPNHSLDFELLQRSRTSAPGFSWLRQQGFSALELCNPTWSNPNDDPPVTYGMAWAFRRELFVDRGFYDAWIVGGGTRLHFFAAHGYWLEAAKAFRFHPTMREHYRRWTEGFHADVRGRWGCVPGEIAHLWHGNLARRKHRQRYADFTQFEFDPLADIAWDEHGAWRWNSNKLAMHQYLRDYIAERQEDDLAAESSAPIALGIAAV